MGEKDTNDERIQTFHNKDNMLLTNDMNEKNETSSIIIELITVRKEEWIKKIERIRELEDIEKKLRTDLDTTNQKYVESLEKHDIEVKELKGHISNLSFQLQKVTEENAQLREQVKSLEEQVQSHSTKISELQKYIAKKDSKEKRKHNKLLLGSVGYNFLDRVLELTFGKKDLDEKRKNLHSIQDIRDNLTNDDQTSKFVAFETMMNEKLKDVDCEDYESIIKEFTKDRIAIAHPTRLSDDSEEDEDPPTAKDLCEIIEQLYKARNRKKFRIPERLL